MDWWWIALILLGSLLALFATGMPVGFCFMLICLGGAFIFWGGEPGLEQLGPSIFSSVATFTLLPLPLFILMGEVMFHSGIAPNMIDAVDKWLGRLPGRLGLIAVAGGTILSTLTGDGMSSVAVLGAALVPEMEKRGYQKPMSLGPILGSSGLAIMIPPTSLGVLLGAVGKISIGGILMGIIFPGLLMAVFYAAYIITRCYLQPRLAPPYNVPPAPLAEKLISTARYILPIGFVVFMVIGVMLLGIATPSEAAATGALSCFLLAAAYRKLNWEVVKKAFVGTGRITVMIFILISAATGFTQIIAVSGVSRGLVELALGLRLVPILIIVGTQLVVLFLGMFMGPASIMMITLPLFMPVVHALNFDPVWFAVVMLLNMEIATTSPPYGLSLFIMKAVGPPDTTIGDCYRAALPFIYCDLGVMTLLFLFPQIALWLPSVTH